MASPVYAVSSIAIHVGEVDAPAGQLKDAQFQVDLKGQSPKLQLKAAVKPKNEAAFVPFELTCGTLLSQQVGFIDCFDGVLTSDVVNTPFSVHIEHRPDHLALDVLFDGASFSDAAGLHAAEGLVGDVQFTAKIAKQK